MIKSPGLVTTRSTVSTHWPAGANGDRAKKAVGAAMSSGNRAGSEVPYAGVLIDVPDVALICDGCKQDWRTFPRTKGRPRGRVYEAKGVVVMVQPKHRGCNFAYCKPVEGATVRIGGKEYDVMSAQDGQFRKQVGK